MFLWWLMNLLGYVVLITTEVLLSIWRRVKKLEIILWEYKEFLFIWEMEFTVYI